MSKIAEAVSPMHPDKIADRIAGALVDYCYDKETDTNSIRCAFEVLIGHGYCLVIGETTVPVDDKFVGETVKRISGEDIETFYAEVSQDVNLNKAQQDGFDAQSEVDKIDKPCSKRGELIKKLGGMNNGKE